MVLPSIPGYGFSDRPRERGFDYRRAAALLVRLMAGLGYPRFAVHAYDIGASIAAFIAFNHADHLLGYHTTEPANPAPYLGPGARDLTDAERDYLEVQRRWEAEEGGYMAVQTTRPQTLAYGLADSPAGLAAWVVEKWRAWTDPPGGTLEGVFTRDQLLANITIYWATGTINSANRLYYERAHNPRRPAPGDRIAVPVGVALTTQAVERAPREYAERTFTDIRRWTELGRGGHFIALEEPALLAGAIRAFGLELRA